MSNFKILKKKLAYQGAILKFYENDMQVPSGKIAKWDYIEHNGAAAIVPVKPNGKIIMVRQYRGAIDEEQLEIPAGARDSKEEDFFVCAMRELEEETGYRTEASNMKHLVDYLSAPAYTSERVNIYYTEDLIPSKQNLDENEEIILEEYTLDELVKMIEDGEIIDGKTVAAIFAYKNVKEKE